MFYTFGADGICLKALAEWHVVKAVFGKIGTHENDDQERVPAVSAGFIAFASG